MNFFIRQALAITLIVALSLQSCVELIEVASLSSSRRTVEHLEAKARPLRQQVEISELVIASLPLTSAEYVLAKERFERLGRGQGPKNGNKNAYRRGNGWTMKLVVSAILIFGIISLRVTRYSLLAMREDLERLKDELVEGEYTRGSVEFVYSHWENETKVMAEMLLQCETREDFVVREGPRIAWSELSGGTDRSRKIGIYLPAGTHRLKYAVADSSTLSRLEKQQFISANPREMAGVVSLNLGPESDVYEFEFRVGEDAMPRITVLGRGNSQIHEHTLALFAGSSTMVAEIPKEGFAFPSEFKPNDEERPYFRKPALLPVTDLGLLSFPLRATQGVTHGTAMIRLWIESDAPACMPAIDVVANYNKVTLLRYRQDSPQRNERVTNADTEFRRLFEPYDGSGRFNFRNGIFQHSK